MIDALGEKIILTDVTAYHIFYQAVCASRTFRQFLSDFPTGIKQVLQTYQMAVVVCYNRWSTSGNTGHSCHPAIVRVERSSYVKREKSIPKETDR